MTAQRVYALDLGSTRFKLGLLSADGRLADVSATTAPRLGGSDLIREGDPFDFLAAADELLATIPSPHDAALGLVSQRSTFTVWDRRTGKPIVPMISWQDRRAHAWCEAHADSEAVLQPLTGLPLSPHYVGPKLAALQAADGEFANRLADENTLFGTLDTWLIWNWTARLHHITDETMAARTSLFDLERRDWATQALELFAVPTEILPKVRATAGWGIRLENGLTLEANIADQAAGTLAALRPGDAAALINFGTGAFVLCPTGQSLQRRTGYISGPILGGEQTEFAIEGTVNGAGPAVDRFGHGPIHWPQNNDPCPQGFAIPDLAGLGSPYWRADMRLEFSASAQDLADQEKRRLVLEGLLFRVYEILLDLGAGKILERVVVSGGLTRDPALALGLASLLGQRVDVLLEPEATLLGTVRMAGDLDPYADPRMESIQPSSAGGYLGEKFSRWRAWLQAMLEQN